MKVSSIDTSAAPKHVMLYGAPKSGKTLIACMLAEYYDLHVLDLDNGIQVAKQLPEFVQDRIDVISIPDTKNWPIAYTTLTRLFKFGKIHTCVAHGADACAACTKYPTDAQWNELDLKLLKSNDILVLDSVTQLSNSIMSHIGRGGGDDWKPEWEDYRKQGSVLDMMLSEIQNAPYHVICISHEAMVQGNDGKDKIVPVAGTAKFSRNTARYFDTVVYCEVKNGRHVAASKTTYANGILTGDRLGVEVENSSQGLLAVFKGDRSENKISQIIAASVVKPTATPLTLRR